MNDKEINQFMIEVLTSKEPYGSAFNKTNKKVYYKPVHIGQANWSIFEKSYENFDFKIRFKKLFEREDLNKSDLFFMENQYKTIKKTEWKFEHRKLKLKKKYRKSYFKYSIPIFNKDKTLAIMWRYQYCGSLCAYSELHIYELKDGVWKIKELIEGWIS
ncbi:hypothetical protein H4O20_13375 [Aequorivita sp. 609]|uniref:hypothetical protein n=1 Tax=Aequorivita TaxID=153265 RepID=UPI0016226B49|nr:MULTISPECIES: hypothetical protein [Aequorivita]MBB6682435.1 hypothetical protein [Aequorivita sp. 609]